MQWLFSLNGDFTQTKKQARKRVNGFIDIIGSQSFTIIYFRDNDLKIIDSYNNMVCYSTPEKANKALKELIVGISETSNIKYIEFLRK
ncbi:MAG: hypothetical protein EKK57_06995 [Proteobacteria bacterium]|nr:MAG: hypothetical protein EKK57_06995 [Pseudomonadota bacterium]